MKNTNKKGLMTAYESNTGNRASDCNSIKSGWAPVIDDLLKQNYSFLGFKYSGNSVLFRGMSTGLLNSIHDNAFGLYKDAKPHAELEQQLKIVFISHELSDAITTSRLWEDVYDAGIVVLSGDLFNQYYDEKRAAMMAFAEPGFVFKYPFFSESIPLEKIKCLFVNFKTYENLKSKLDEPKFSLLARLLIIIDHSEITRADFENKIKQILANKKFKMARPVKTNYFPKKPEQ